MAAALISTNDISYNKETKTFSEEISCLPNFGGLPKRINILNPKTNVSKIFIFTHKDTDGSGEDTYGWWFLNVETGVKLLIIND